LLLLAVRRVTIGLRSMEGDIVGREEVLASLRAFLREKRGSPAGLVIEGEPGIGKSTVWLAGVEAARAQGMRVLLSRSAEAERGLAYVALIDLFEGVVEDILPLLSAPRRYALEAALLLDGTSTGRVDQRALGVGVRNVIEILGEREPVLIALDDVQWLEPSSAGTLAFALRRLSESPVRLLLARRGGARPSGLDEELRRMHLERLHLGPLSVGALHSFLRDRLGRSFARQTLLRIHERSGGNPFFAYELARAVDMDGDPFARLPVPATLEELLRARIDALPVSTREALRLASALGTVSEALLVRAGIDVEILGPAAAAGLIDRAGGGIVFTHPLLATVLYADLGDERWEIHARIAALVSEPLAHARHLALSRRTPDAEVANALEQGATIAAERGAQAAAAELSEHAVRLTPLDRVEERRSRTLAAARAHQAAGEWTRARVLATGLLAEPGLTSSRVESLILLAELETIDRAVGLLEEALGEAASRPALMADIHCRLAWAGRFRGEAGHARSALELAEKLDDDELMRRARAVQAVLAWFAGDAEAPPVRARDFAAAVGGDQLVQEATLAFVNTNAPSSRRSEAREALEAEHREWRERDEPRSGHALWGLAWLEFWSGRWDLATSYAASAHDISIQYGLERPQDHLPIAVVAVHRGQLATAREHSNRALELAEEQFVLHPPQHLATLGLVASWSGDEHSALDWFARAERRALEFGWREPSVRWWTADHAELLLSLGRTEEALEIVELWEGDAIRVGRLWVLPHVTRCRGLAGAARGDVRGAATLLERAAVEHEAVGDPYGAARAQLALGVVRRRSREKRGARDSIEAALTAFAELGAETWITTAREELGRIGGRTREAGLTAAERRVASLVADGKTNREVAAALFLGERTVASHLTHIYAKLGIRSRTELARKVQTF
jgi:DNA-binding CsgD family transcriptional regulator